VAVLLIKREITMKILNYIARITAFIIAALLTFFGIVAVDVVVIPLTLDYPGDYQGGVSTSAMIIASLSIYMLFKKIIFRKAIKTLIIALIFYIVCTAIAVISVALGYVDIAYVFGWIGIAGLLGYFLIIKPFKKSMIEEGDSDDEML
jgi:hypothetical protein